MYLLETNKIFDQLINRILSIKGHEITIWRHFNLNTLTGNQQNNTKENPMKNNTKSMHEALCNLLQDNHWKSITTTTNIP